VIHVSLFAKRRDTNKRRGEEYTKKKKETKREKNHWHCIRFLNLIGFMQEIL